MFLKEDWSQFLPSGSFAFNTHHTLFSGTCFTEVGPGLSCVSPLLDALSPMDADSSS